jgi:hypothetical protein
MMSAAGTPVDKATDVYDSAPDATAIDLVAEIKVNPREGAGSSVPDRVEFYKEGDGPTPQLIGRGTRISGTSPAQFRLSYAADAHGTAGEVRTYFANCVARSTVNGTKKVPSYSRPVRIRRAGGAE